VTDFIVVAGALAWPCLAIACIATTNPRTAARAWAASAVTTAGVAAAMGTAGHWLPATAWLVVTVPAAVFLRKIVRRARRQHHVNTCATCRAGRAAVIVGRTQHKENQ